MCGIVGYWDKTGDPQAALGKTVLQMMTPLGCRGPDSAGVALFASEALGATVVRVKLGEMAASEERAGQVAHLAEQFGEVREISHTGAYLRFTIGGLVNSTPMVSALEGLSRDIEVVSLGRRLEIVKQVGSPKNLDDTYGISAWRGTHGIGHTRLSTESKVDLSHSQPFWAHGCPDLAIVHNGHITNYHQLRRGYEQHGVRFYTENDSEIIGIYLAEQLRKSLSLEEALHRSLSDLDGSFSFLVATADAMGFVRDPFALKPLTYTETDRFAAVATEEIAIRSAFPDGYMVREAQAKEVRVWQR